MSSCQALDPGALQPLNYLSQVPPNVTLDQASTVPIGLATAAFGLYNRKGAGGIALTAPWEEGGRGKYADEPILVIGGASAVGQQGTLSILDSLLH